jgi:hypothetical protein
MEVHLDSRDLGSVLDLERAIGKKDREVRTLPNQRAVVDGYGGMSVNGNAEQVRSANETVASLVEERGTLPNHMTKHAIPSCFTEPEIDVAVIRQRHWPTSGVVVSAT